jgi:hypothetical protein
LQRQEVNMLPGEPIRHLSVFLRVLWGMSKLNWDALA